MLRNSLLLGGSVAILGAVMAPAQASTIDTDIWYAGFFGTAPIPYPLQGGGPPFLTAPGTSAPDGNPTAFAPDSPWTITLSKPGELTFTDVGLSGAQFALTFTGATTGTVMTSTPALGADVGSCISCALADPDFSSGCSPSTRALQPSVAFKPNFAPLAVSISKSPLVFPSPRPGQ
jgi:hypothetical protein